jgi:hypothetical protein
MAVQRVDIERALDELVLQEQFPSESDWHVSQDRLLPGGPTA